MSFLNSSSFFLFVLILGTRKKYDDYIANAKKELNALEKDDLENLKLENSSGSFKDIYKHFIKNKKNKIDMEDVHKEYSFLNRWFIFKKYTK